MSASVHAFMTVGWCPFLTHEIAFRFRPRAKGPVQPPAPDRCNRDYPTGTSIGKFLVGYRMPCLFKESMMSFAKRCVSRPTSCGATVRVIPDHSSFPAGCR
jgi:hypothetical protein